MKKRNLFRRCATAAILVGGIFLTNMLNETFAAVSERTVADTTSTTMARHVESGADYTVSIDGGWMGGPGMITESTETDDATLEGLIDSILGFFY